MKVIPRYLSSQDAEVLARTVEVREVVRGCVEVHGLSWRSDALRAWEIVQREMGRRPKVEVRIDELDLGVAYVDVPEKGVGPFMAISRQPEFAKGLSIFELNRLKRLVERKAIDDRLGRLSDNDAMALRIAHYEELGHRNDPIAQKRLADRHDEVARLRLQIASAKSDADEPDSVDVAPPQPSAGESRQRQSKKVKPATECAASSKRELEPSAESAQPPATPTTDSLDEAFESFQIKRSYE